MKKPFVRPSIPEEMEISRPDRISRRKFLRMTALLGVSTAAAEVMAGCAQPTPVAVPPTNAPAAAATAVPKATVVPVPTKKWTGPQFGGTVNLVRPQAMVSADAPSTTASMAQLISIHINEGLVALSEDLKIVPMLAESWTTSADGLTWTFKLRQGIKFHNGAEMTSEDVLATVKRHKAMSARKQDWAVIETADAPDKYTVVFKLNRKTGSFLLYLASPLADLGIQPKSVILDATGNPKPANGLKVPDEIIGTGPYKLVEYNPDSVAVLKRHDDYQPLPGERNGLAGGKIPYFDEFRINVVPEAAAQIAGMQTGTYDTVHDISATTYGTLAKGSASGVQTMTYYPGSMIVLLINHADKWTGNPKFRQAVQAAIDIEELALFSSGGDKTLFSLNPSLWSQGTALYMPDDPVAKGLYNQKNLDKARQLLKESGYNGEEIIIHNQNDQLTPAFADQIKKIGINAKLKVVDAAADNAGRAEKTGWNFTYTGMGSPLYVPITFRTYWHSTSNNSVRGHYASPAMDAALDAADAALTFEDQKKAYADVQRIVYEDVVLLRLWDSPRFQAIRTPLKGYKPFLYPRLFSVWREK